MKLYPGLNLRLDNVRIGTKLTLAFFLVLTLTLLLGGFSIIKLAQVNQVSSDLALKWMPSVGHTTTMRSAMLEFRDLEVKHIRAADAGYMDEYEEKMKAALAIVTQESGGYEKMIEGEEGKQLFEKFSKAWAEYLVVNKKVIALGRASKPDDAKDIGEGAANRCPMMPLRLWTSSPHSILQAVRLPQNMPLVCMPAPGSGRLACWVAPS